MSHAVPLFGHIKKRPAGQLLQLLGHSQESHIPLEFSGEFLALDSGGERTLPFHLPPLPHFPLYNICNFSFRIKFVFSGFVFYNALAALICSFNGSAVENFALTSVRQACVAHAISQSGSQSLSEYIQENFLRMPSPPFTSSLETTKVLQARICGCFALLPYCPRMTCHLAHTSRPAASVVDSKRI